MVGKIATDSVLKVSGGLVKSVGSEILLKFTNRERNNLIELPVD